MKLTAMTDKILSGETKQAGSEMGICPQKCNIFTSSRKKNTVYRVNIAAV